MFECFLFVKRASLSLSRPTTATANKPTQAYLNKGTFAERHGSFDSGDCGGHDEDEDSSCVELDTKTAFESPLLRHDISDDGIAQLIRDAPLTNAVGLFFVRTHMPHRDILPRNNKPAHYY